MMPEPDTRGANPVRVATLAMAIALAAGCADDATAPGPGAPKRGPRRRRSRFPDAEWPEVTLTESNGRTT